VDTSIACDHGTIHEAIITFNIDIIGSCSNTHNSSLIDDGIRV